MTHNWCKILLESDAVFEVTQMYINKKFTYLMPYW